MAAPRTTTTTTPDASTTRDPAPSGAPPRWVVAGALLWATLGAALIAGARALAPAEAGSAALGWTLGLGSVTGVALAVRVALWWRYSPTPPVPDAALPSLTVVVPAFQEGARVRKAIASLLDSAYPAERLHVVAVDDGSTDDTLAHLEAAAAVAPGRVTVLALPTNSGKRHAVYAGLQLATSELVATVDSDSRVRVDALRALVAPLVRDPTVAGVAGKVAVWNRDDGWLPRLLDVRYGLGFDVVRAYQSRLHTVWCCPGALQAYRRGVVAPHLDAWRDQRFLGARCTNGDDHAMTNLVLSLGHRTTYQASAIVETVVPTRYRGLTRMYTRWGRSATREGLRALRFAPRRCRRLGGVVGPLVFADAALQVLGIGARGVGFPAAIALLVMAPHAALAGLGATTMLAALYALLYLRADPHPRALLAVPYAWFAALALPWVQPYATLTVRSSRWLTRRANPPAP